MLQLQSGKIVELTGPHAGMTAEELLADGGGVPFVGNVSVTGVSNCSTVLGGGYDNHFGVWPATNYAWSTYPIYVCTDKTAKAIQVLKQLEADKAIELKSVKRFVEMVEKIAAIL
jgi:hypothetical protein